MPPPKRTLWNLVALALILAGLIGAVRGAHAGPPSPDAELVVLYFFYGEFCPVCKEQEPLLEELSQAYPNLVVRSYEIYRVEENRVLLERMADALGFQVRAVPTTIIGDRHWEGYTDRIAEQIRAHVERCSVEGCADAGAGLVLQDGTPAPPSTPSVDDGPTHDPRDIVGDPIDLPADELTLPWIGTINLGEQSLAFSTVLIAFVDGFNPCSIWVLSILLSLVLRTGSRKKILLIGLLFLIVTASVYSLFIAGLFSFMSIIAYLWQIQVLVALIALFFAGVNIKDYFWYKEGVSLTISDESKPGLYRSMRRIMNAESLWGMAAATVVMGVGVSLVELPCTAGFPMLWTSIVAAHGVDALSFALLLGLYVLVYLVIELVLFVTALVTLRASRLQEKHGRVLKLVGGTLMLALAIVMLVDPMLMSQVSTTIMVFAGAFVAAFVVLLVHRLILPQFGIHIGTELQPEREQS